MELTIEEALQQGVAAHKEGKLQEAERLYRVILQSQPAHPDANHNLGVLAVSVNKADAALPLFKTALEANPKIEQFWLSYIDALIKEKQFDNAKQVIEQANKQGVAGEKLNTLEAQLSFETQNINSANPSQQQLNSLLEYYQTGRFGDAEKLAVSITQKFPKHQFGWKVLGTVLKQTGRVIDSLTGMQKSVQLAPQDAEAHSNLGNTLQELGRSKDAEASYRKAIALKPDYANAHSNLGNTLQELGRSKDAEASYRKAIALKPDYAEAHSNLGVTLQELGRLEEAEASYRKAIALKPDYAEAHSNLGNTLQELGRLKEAKASYRKAIALKPDYAEAHNNMGNALTDQGKPEEAIAAYNEALLIKPDYAEAHRNLSALKKYEYSDPQIVQMEKLYAGTNISVENQCHLCFALAKSSEDLGNLEEAFRYLKEGNALRKKILNYDIIQDEEIFSRIKETANSFKNFSFNASGDENIPTPILILGMPRSGTTLVEQIISNHSKVTAAGELGFLKTFGSSLSEGKVEVSGDKLRTIRNQYLNEIKKLSAGRPFVTDKMPDNFFYIGLICSALPEAKIIHVKRNPAATCWSNYKQRFAVKGLGYSYDLLDVVHYFQMYEELMLFWGKHYPGKIYHLDYEQLTTDQEPETKKLIHYLGIDWEDACLSPEENMRYVKTASNLQVRKKVYKGSSREWKKFEKYLDRAFDGLPN